MQIVQLKIAKDVFAVYLTYCNAYQWVAVSDDVVFAFVSLDCLAIKRHFDLDLSGLIMHPNVLLLYSCVSEFTL